MILATNCRLPELDTAPPSKLARFEIEACSAMKNELGADEWVFTKHAPPHTDPESMGLFLLTLSCVSGWFFGDARHSRRLKSSGVEVPAGALFVVDMRECHWLCPTEPPPLSFKPPEVWVGLQWFCKDYRALRDKARAVRSKLGGQWEHLQLERDTRYRRIAMGVLAN